MGEKDSLSMWKFCYFVDIVFAASFTACLYLLLLCASDRYKRIVLTDAEIMNLKNIEHDTGAGGVVQVGESGGGGNHIRPPSPVQWPRRIVNSFLIIFALSNMAYVLGISTHAFYFIASGVDFTGYNSVLADVDGLVLLGMCIMEYSLNISMVRYVSRNLIKTPQSRMTNVVTSIDVFSWFKSILSNIDYLLYIKVGSLMSIILLSDLAFLILAAYTTYTTSSIEAIIVPSVVTIHLNSSFYLFDYLFECAMDIKEVMKNHKQLDDSSDTQQPSGVHEVAALKAQRGAAVAIALRNNNNNNGEFLSTHSGSFSEFVSMGDAERSVFSDHFVDRSANSQNSVISQRVSSPTNRRLMQEQGLQALNNKKQHNKQLETWNTE